MSKRYKMCPPGYYQSASDIYIRRAYVSFCKICVESFETNRRGVFRTMTYIENGAFWEKSSPHSAINYFH